MRFHGITFWKAISNAVTSFVISINFFLIYDILFFAADNQWTNQDEDMGPISRISDDSAAAGKHSHFFILINNLEKDLNPLTIKDFIYEKTTIIPEACVFPSRLTDPFARGAIMVDSLKKAQTVEEYLDNANHLIVSSRGRYSSEKNTS